MNKKILITLLVFSLIITNGFPEKTSAAAGKNIFANSRIQPMVSGGYNFSVILKDDGTVWACGGNEVANLGTNGFYYGNILPPKQVLGLSDVVAIDCADAFTLALKSDGTVWGWGFNMYNNLGVGKPETCVYASEIVGIRDVKAIAAGNPMSIFVKKDGTVWYVCQENGKSSKPKQMKNLKDVVTVSSSHCNAIAMSKTREVWTWEWESTPKEDGYKIVNLEKQKLSGIKSVAAGEFHYMALEKDGDLWLWGMNNHGEIGDGTKEWCYSPKKILTKVKLISGGGYYSCAELEDGTFYAWGDNECGQFGNNSTKSSSKPVEVKGFQDVICMDAGMCHTLAINNKGEVIIAGNNYDGVLGVSDKKEHNTPVKLMDLSKKSSNTGKTEIYPNGDLSDWGNTVPIASGTPPKNEKLVGIKELYATLPGDGNLYLAASITSGIPDYVNFYLDVNDDNKADYKVSFTDDKYAEVCLYKINGKTLKKVNDEYGVYGNIIEAKVCTDDIGNPEKVTVKAAYGADKKTNGVNTEITKWSVAAGSKLAVEDRVIPMGAITIDGKIDEWEKLNKTIIVDPKGESECNADITTIYAARDSKYLYIAAEVTGNPSVCTKVDINGDGIEDYGANASARDGAVYYFCYIPGKDLNEITESENIAYSGKYLEFAVPLSEFENPKDLTLYVWADNNDGKGTDDAGGYYEVSSIGK